MDTLYLDTSVILCGFHPAETDKSKAMKLLAEDYMISKIVHEEIKDIKKRRFSIYKSISNLLDDMGNSSKILTVDDLYKRGFKSNYENNSMHDNGHLDSLFEYILKELNLNRNINLNKNLLEKFLKKVDEVFDEIKFEFIRILNNLNDPLYCQERVVQENIGGKYKQIHKHFKKIKGYSKNKNDIRILIHGVEYSCYTQTKLNIISNDKYMVRIKEDVENYALMVFKERFFEIYSLSSYRMN